jgi:hypothetical protein
MSLNESHVADAANVCGNPHPAYAAHPYPAFHKGRGGPEERRRLPMRHRTQSGGQLTRIPCRFKTL